MAEKEESRGARAVKNILTRKKSSSDPNINKHSHLNTREDTGAQEGRLIC